MTTWTIDVLANAMPAVLACLGVLAVAFVGRLFFGSGYYVKYAWDPAVNFVVFSCLALLFGFASIADDRSQQGFRTDPSCLAPLDPAAPAGACRTEIAEVFATADLAKADYIPGDTRGRRIGLITQNGDDVWVTLAGTYPAAFWNDIQDRTITKVTVRGLNGRIITVASPDGSAETEANPAENPPANVAFTLAFTVGSLLSAIRLIFGTN